MGSRDDRLSVADIRARIADASFDDMGPLLDELAGDDRATVARLVATARRRHEREAADRERVLAMYRLARQAGGDGVVVGVDEVGRGSVAGPLTVAAVALPDDPVVWGIDDSKRLTPQRREELAARIAEVAVAIGIAHVPPEDIDRDGMAHSLRRAMAEAIANTGVSPDAVLIDGNPVHVHPREQTFTHGDGRFACIAAASIVAKVTRDEIMVQADARYPGYGFAASKGYASPEHIAAIRAHGLTDYHRATFCQNFLH